MPKHPTPIAHLSQLAVASLAVASLATADPASKVYDLKDFVVVDTRTPISLDRASPSVDLISAEEMAKWQDQSITDALSRTPGMVLWSIGSAGSLTSISTRGTESNHTGFFLDGRRMNPGFGNQYDVEFLPLDNLGSLEVQRGASTVNFGTSGIGGVINARSRSAMGLKAPELAVTAELGANSHRQGRVTAAVGTEQMGLSVAASTLTTDNERAHDGYTKSSFVGRFDMALTDRLTFELLGTAFDTEKELPGPIVAPKLFDVEETNSWLISPGLRWLTDELSVHLFYSRAERRSDIFAVNSAFDFMVFPAVYLGDFPISNEIDVISDEVDLQVDYSISDGILLTTGLSYRNDVVRNTNLNTFSPLNPPTPYGESFQQWGFYGLISWQLSEAFELRGGVRYDDYSEYDDELTGNVTFIYNLPKADASVFVKVANAYAPPSAVDLAYDSDFTTPLNAEESKSYEVGFRHRLKDGRLEYSVVLFRNDIDQLLSFEPSTFDTFNIEKSKTEGLEFSLQYQACDWLLLGGGYTYLIAESERLNDPRTGGFVADPAKGVPLARRPKHLLQLSAFVELTEQLSWGLQAVGQFDREDIDPVSFLQVPAEDFFVVRLVANWEIDAHWSVQGRVENLLDESYASAAGYPALGRAGYLGLRYEF